jgi:hypothetical protein
MDSRIQLARNELPELTAKEKNSPYADYYYRTIAEPPPEILAAFQPDKPMDPAKAILPEDMGMFADPNCPDPEMGYCKLPGGGGYSCVVAKMPGMKKEHFDFRLRLVLADHFGFVIEYPGFHLEHYDGMCIEDFAEGQMHALILDRCYSPAELGLSVNPADVNPKILGFMVKEADVIPLEGPIDPHRGLNTLAFVMRQMENGIEYWAFAYSGIHVENGKAVTKLAPGEVVTEEKCRLRGLHHAYEYANEAQILPALYDLYGQEDLPGAKPWPERYRFLQHS